MPTYEYRCPSGHDFERFYRKISDAAPAVTCPECGKVAERIMSVGGGLLFKGSGFYLTDYGKNAHRGGAAPKPDGGGGDSASASSDGSGSKESSSSDSSPSKESSAKESSGAKDSNAKSSGGESKPAASKPVESKAKSESKPAKSGGSKSSKDK